ncbi:LamG-like jellyroll fold domain-containing protein [Streptomyces sp. NPDC057555]|uniref:LamG-like jellyroll fold domain-containing protein n=1 Tax=Streptomyces sp. NPDC057555 TaxID=3346166 RepID=UPI0036A3F75E
MGRSGLRHVRGVLAAGIGGLLAAGLLPVEAAPSAWAQPRTTVPAAPRAAKADGAATVDAAVEQARRTSRSVEIDSLRGEATDVVATPDGKLQARQYLRPVRTRVGGQWRDIDTTLAKTDDGAVAPKATAVDLTLSGGGSGPLVRMRRAGRDLALSWPGTLPAPEIDGAMATYHDVLPDVDLRMGAQEDGFTQLLVVKSAEAAASKDLEQLRWKVAAAGMDVRATTAGGLEAVDKGARNPVFEAPTPMMWDSSPGTAPEGGSPAVRAKGVAAAQNPAAGEEPAAGESGKLARVEVHVPESRDQVVLTPDADVLKGKDTVYPVFIDPQWSTPRATAWTVASKYWASSPQWKFNGDPDAGLGYCNWNYCKPNDTKRLFYRLPTSAFSGRSVLSAEFVVRNTWSASCDKREVQLWRTKDISSSTTWNSQNADGFWAKMLDKDSFAYGYQGCAAKDAEFDVKATVQEAADKHWSSLTFGLKAGSESDGKAWKRFSDKAYLRVKYNRPPPQVKPSQLTMEYGGSCKKSDVPARVRTRGKLYANNITDPDGDDVSVQFQASWDAHDGKGTIARWKPGLTTAKKSGSSFSVMAPVTPSSTKVNWYVRVYDGAQYSPWSYTGPPEACYYVYDTSVPAAPAITSGAYPASDPENPDDPWYDGVGQYGDFTLKSASSDVTRYRYGINTDPSAKNQVTTSGGAAKTLDVLPGKPGLNFVTAQAFDEAGNGSEIRTYPFRVKAGQPERATWQMNEGKGAAQAEGSTPARTADLHGGAALGAEGVVGTGLSLNGTDGYAATDIPVIDTSRGFSVSAWARLDEVPDHAAVIATQPGNKRPGFELYYSSAYQRWVFNQYTSDSTDATVARAMADTPGGVTAGAWTHLVGAYDSVAHMLRLYVDGKLAGETPYATAWNARRGLQLGAGSYSGKPDAFFPGTLDEIQIFDKPVSAAEVGRLYSKEHILGPGRPARAVFPLDEPAGSAQVTGHGDVMPAVFHGGAKPGEPGVAGKALTLDGKDGHASVSAPHFNTSRSYAVTAWARVTDSTRNQTVVAQDGGFLSAFYLSYETTGGVWSIRLATKDAEDGTLTQQRVASRQKASLGQWTHLAAVHDTVAGTVSLYVNGVLQGSAAAPNAWYGDCALQIGRALYRGAYTDYVAGQIDDVRLFDRPVSEDEVHQLFQQRPVLASRWQFDQESAPGTNSVPDGPAMTLAGARQSPEGAFLGEGGLVLDGVKDYAHSPVPLDTSASFTVTAWVRAAAVPTRPAAVLSAEGERTSGFSLGVTPRSGDPFSDGLWRVALASEDSDDATTDTALSAQQFTSVTDWNHLAVVYDGFAKQVRLYLNGELNETACVDTDDDGQPDDLQCTDAVPWAENVIPFKALKSLQLGRAKISGTFGEYWPGAVDDVWAFEGALSDRQIGRIAHEWFDLPTEVPEVP